MFAQQIQGKNFLMENSLISRPDASCSHILTTGEEVYKEVYSIRIYELILLQTLQTCGDEWISSSLKHLPPRCCGHLVWDYRFCIRIYLPFI